MYILVVAVAADKIIQCKFVLLIFSINFQTNFSVSNKKKIFSIFTMCVHRNRKHVRRPFIVYCTFWRWIAINHFFLSLFSLCSFPTPMRVGSEKMKYCLRAIYIVLLWQHSVLIYFLCVLNGPFSEWYLDNASYKKILMRD